MKKLNYSQRIQFETELFKNINNEKAFIRVSFLPKQISEVGINGQKETSFEHIAIILQGPIDNKDEFTYETVKMYLQYYPKVKVIVSTWKDTGEAIIEKFEKLQNVKVILNEYPRVNGIGNINYQLKTSLSGVLYAREHGVRYIWKTRTDQRFYNPFALNELIGTYQTEKLSFLGAVTNSHVNRLFHISDFMVFGEVKDIEVYFSCPFDLTDTSISKHYRLNQESISKEMLEYFKWTEECENNLDLTFEYKLSESPMKYANPEMLLSYNYYKMKSLENHNSEWDLKDEYQDFLNNYVVIVDADILGLYWDKYDHQAIQQTYFERKGKLDHARWVSIRRNCISDS